MEKKTKGYILLTLLVITGLANQVPHETLTGKERTVLVASLKKGKEDFLNSVNGLSVTQLSFKSKQKPSVQDCILRLTTTENRLWRLTAATLKKPLDPAKRKVLVTNDVLAERLPLMIGGKEKVPLSLTGEQSTNKALEDFKKGRNNLIKYVKTTTDDVRNHVTETPLGYADAYQVMSSISAYTNNLVQQIEEIKADPHFPK